MPNITLTVDEDVYRRARIYAAEHGTSVSALVAAHLRSLTGQDEEFARLAALQDDIVAGIGAFSAVDRVSRDELHERA